MCPSRCVVERLNPTRSLTHHPLVQVMLAWQQPARETSDEIVMALGDLQVTQVPLDTRTARVDLAFSLARTLDPGRRARRDRRDGRVPHRRVRRGQHRGADRAVAAGVGGDDRRPDPAALVGGSCSTRPSAPASMRWVTVRC